jgi:hypothetical protein
MQCLTINTQQSTINNQQSTINNQHSTLNTHHSPFTIHHSPFTIHHAPLNVKWMGKHQQLGTESMVSVPHKGGGIGDAARRRASQASPAEPPPTARKHPGGFTRTASANASSLQIGMAKRAMVQSLSLNLAGR